MNSPSVPQQALLFADFQDGRMKNKKCLTLITSISFLVSLSAMFSLTASYAQTPNSSDQIIEPNSSVTSRIIDVTKIDNIFEVPSWIAVDANSNYRSEQTTLARSIKTKSGAYYWVSEWRWLFCLSPIAVFGLIVMVLQLITERDAINVGRVALGLGGLAVIATLAVTFIKFGPMTDHIILMYFDNASNNKYEVMVNEERFNVDEMSYLQKEIRWGSLSSTVEDIVEIRIFSTTPNVGEVERLKIRVNVGRGRSKTYVYNIGGVNKYTVETVKYKRL